MNVTQLKQFIVSRLTPVVGMGEAAAMSKMIFEIIINMTPVDIALNPNREIEPETVSKIKTIIEKVVAGEPLQYALGVAWFMGMRLHVDNSTLIPRPETAQLVDIITDYARDKADLSVLDICTGSGCIAIALARALPFSTVRATDISDGALKVAKQNAIDLNVSIDFEKEDALNMGDSNDHGVYNIIVSNPPYVSPEEAKDMDPRVLDYEPASAIFAPSSDPLIFYRSIAGYAIKALKPSGSLFFEINPMFATQLAQMLSNIGFSSVDIIRDFDARNRFAVCCKNNNA